MPLPRYTASFPDPVVIVSLPPRMDGIVSGVYGYNVIAGVVNGKVSATLARNVLDTKKILGDR